MAFANLSRVRVILPIGAVAACGLLLGGCGKITFREPVDPIADAMPEDAMPDTGPLDTGIVEDVGVPDMGPPPMCLDNGAPETLLDFPTTNPTVDAWPLTQSLDVYKTLFWDWAAEAENTCQSAACHGDPMNAMYSTPYIPFAVDDTNYGAGISHLWEQLIASEMRPGVGDKGPIWAHYIQSGNADAIEKFEYDGGHVDFLTTLMDEVFGCGLVRYVNSWSRGPFCEDPPPDSGVRPDAGPMDGPDEDGGEPDTGPTPPDTGASEDCYCDLPSTAAIDQTNCATN